MILGRDTAAVQLASRYLNRHALVAGATGTGKTTTLATMAERISRGGTPCAVLDVKGDLAGLATANPVRIRDPFNGRDGLDVSRLGPDLIARALDLSEAQAGALDVAFAYAAETGARLDTLADLRDVLRDISANARAVSDRIGQVSPASVAVVQRATLRLERDAADAFGRQSLDVATFDDHSGAGPAPLHVIPCDRLTRTPGLYATLCAFILTDLFERLPELGDAARPRLAVFLDEAHLIFDGAAPGLVRRLEQIVRLIRSKGVALIFVTQSPADLPSGIAGQLQNRIQHGLRAVTPADARGMRAAVDSLPRGDFDAFTALGELRVGEALVSLVEDGGRPGALRRIQVARCQARLGPLPVTHPAMVAARRIEAPEAVEVEVEASPEAEPFSLGDYAPREGAGSFARRMSLACLVAVPALWGLFALIGAATR